MSQVEEKQLSQELETIRKEAGELALENRLIQKNLEEQGKFLTSVIQSIIEKTGMEVHDGMTYIAVVEQFLATNLQVIPEEDDVEVVVEEEEVSED